MKKFLERLWKNEKGFTLIELIIVIAILAIIAAVAVPNILRAVDNSRRTTDVSNAKIIADAIATVRASNENFSATGETFTFNAAGITAATDATFAAAVLTQLNNNAPTPSFAAATALGADRFIATVAVNGQITVIASDGTNNANLFPTPAAVYDNQ